MRETPAFDIVDYEVDAEGRRAYFVIESEWFSAPLAPRADGTSQRPQKHGVFMNDFDALTATPDGRKVLLLQPPESPRPELYMDFLTPSFTQPRKRL